MWQVFVTSLPSAVFMIFMLAAVGVLIYRAEKKHQPGPERVNLRLEAVMKNPPDFRFAEDQGDKTYIPLTDPDLGFVITPPPHDLFSKVVDYFKITHPDLVVIRCETHNPFNWHWRTWETLGVIIYHKHRTI